MCSLSTQCPFYRQDIRCTLRIVGKIAYALLDTVPQPEQVLTSVDGEVGLARSLAVGVQEEHMGAHRRCLSSVLNNP
jgi:hypothetical protein